MCGIVGFVGSWDYPTLKTMTSTLLHRGPDEEGYHYARLDPDEKYIGMGHRRLSIIDLSSGRQPIWNEDRTKAIIFNGEIYN